MEPRIQAVTGEYPVVIGLEHKVAELDRHIQDIHERLARQSGFQRWIVGLLLTVALSISGVAYNAHSVLAARLIEVGTKQGETLARIEERLNAMEKRMDRER